MDDKEARREGSAEDRERLDGQGHGRGTEGQGKELGEDPQRKVGDEAAGHAEYAADDPGMETGQSTPDAAAAPASN